MDVNAAAQDVEVVQSWGYSRTEAIHGVARWAFRQVRRHGADTSTLCYLQGLNAMLSSVGPDGRFGGDQWRV